MHFSTCVPHQTICAGREVRYDQFEMQCSYVMSHMGYVTMDFDAATCITIAKTWYLLVIGLWGDPDGSVPMTTHRNKRKDFFILSQ